MPSYFYHLKFELYATTNHIAQAQTTHKPSPDQTQTIWLPPPNSDIFAQTWPNHKPASTTTTEHTNKHPPHDWRFGPVRIEAIDMPPAGLVDAGRVTKAEFRAAKGKGTEVGWGVVHLYRDGEESTWVGAEGLGAGAGEDCTTLCIPAVPSYLTPSDFLGFVGEATRGLVSHFRMVMTGRMNRYLVLMKFRDGAAARKWRAEWDGKVFNSMEPETCHVMFIKSITFQTPANPNASFPELSHDPFTPSAAAASFMKPFPPPTPNLVELPTCPVCLERMDDTTGLLTILCQHVFHCHCLQKWRGTGCPVCRHTNPSLASQLPSGSSSSDPSNPPFGSSAASLCTVCDCADDLWICLICGNVGCGRYKRGHAKEHWKNSAHNFALEIETQHVWDYAGDMWVHRLIRDKGDSKVIELPSGRPGRGGDDMVPREKLESIGIEYTHLLTSQLESQRVYFEELVGKAVAKASAANATASSASSRADDAIARLEALRLEHTRLRDDVVASLEKELVRERRKAERSAELARGFSNSLKEEKKVSEGLMKRIEHVNSTVESLNRELEDVREQNHDLMFAVTGGAKLRTLGFESLDIGELEGATLSLPGPPEEEDKEKEKEKEKRKAGAPRRLGKGRARLLRERENGKGLVEVGGEKRGKKGKGKESGSEKEKDSERESSEKESEKESEGGGSEKGKGKEEA